MYKFNQKQLKLGIVSNEFFDPSLGRMGGFGMAVRQVAECFQSNPGLNFEPVFIAAQLRESESHPQKEIRVHNTRLLLRPRNRLEFIQRIRAEKLDVLLTMDYRIHYRPIFWMLPRTPIIIWVHDPRTSYDTYRITSTRLPGEEAVPQGLKPVDCTSLAQVVRISRWTNRSVLFATPAMYLSEKILDTYGVKVPTEQVIFLPNMMEHILGSQSGEIQVQKSQRPTVVFLARLDPYKRPWVFVELARYFPEVEFIMMGKPHFEGRGSWQPTDLPTNIKLMGHVDGEEKMKILSSAWVLVNTSIHEGLAISFLEAFAHEIPVLSCVDPENVVSRYGIYVGRWEGTGMAAIPYFVDGLKRLLESPELRHRLGKAGREWVENTHNQRNFLRGFKQLCDQAQVTNHQVQSTNGYENCVSFRRIS
ncbi:MAG: glycosyltransferase family 4 protein [Microcoleaceae cyanobacterium]